MATRSESPMWDESIVLREMDFETLATRYIEIKETIDDLEREKKGIGQSMEAAMIVADMLRVRYDDRFIIERCNGGTAAKIDPRRLAELGVSAEIIQAATAPGGKYTYIQAVDTTKQKPQKGAAGATSTTS